MIPSRPRVRAVVAGLFALALTVRLIVALAHPLVFPDSADYFTLARHLAQGEPYVTQGMFAQRLPGYPVFLAAIFALGGGGTAVLVVQSVLGAGVALVAWRLGRRVNEPVGLLAALLVALDPLQIAFSAAVLTEVPFTLLFLLIIWLLVLQTESPRWWRWPTIGLLFGLSVLLRASVLWCIVPLAAWVVLAHRPRRWATLVGAVTAVLVMFGVLTPWLARNHRVFGSGVLRLSTLEGISLYESVYPDATGGPRQDVILNHPPAAVAGLNEAQRDDYYARAAWRYIREDPLRIARLALVKFARTWSPVFHAAEARSWPLQAALVVWTVPVYILAIMGLAQRRIPLPVAGLLLIPLLYFSLIHALFLGSVRYRVPLMPLVEIFAAAGLLGVLRHSPPADGGQPPPPARV